MSVLVVAPHADDEVLGCGGTIAALTRKGHRVDVVVMSTGDESIFSADERQAIATEMDAAHRHLGISTTQVLGFPAPRLGSIAENEIVDALMGVIHELQPRTVYVPHHADPHLDHSVTFRAALVATRPRIGQCVRTLLAYETLSETEWSDTSASSWFVPNVYVDIESTLAMKVAAMRIYDSQLRPWPETRSIEAIEALARLRGSTIGVTAAEAFRLVRTTEGIALSSRVGDDPEQG